MATQVLKSINEKSTIWHIKQVNPNPNHVHAHHKSPLFEQPYSLLHVTNIILDTILAIQEWIWGKIFKTRVRVHINNAIQIHNSNQPNLGDEAGYLSECKIK